MTRCEYFPKCMELPGSGPVNQRPARAPSTSVKLEMSIAAQTMNRYSSSGNPPIQKPRWVSAGKVQMRVRIAHPSHGTLKISAQTAHMPIVRR